MRGKSLFVILISFLSFSSWSQISGYGLIDGVYGFTLTTELQPDGLLEGTVEYEDGTGSKSLFAYTHNDTFQAQETDDLFNATSKFFLIKRADYYEGFWIDVVREFQLPVLFYPNKAAAKISYEASRYDIDWNREDIQKLFELPLSPTVDLGKYLINKNKSIDGYTSISQFSKVEYYSALDEMEFKDQEVAEVVSMEFFHFKDAKHSLEAIIPNYGETFVDSLQSALVRWKEQIDQQTKRLVDSRFPERFYAICDLDFWSEYIVSGSFEYIGPTGSVDGFTFIYERKNDRFISINDIWRGGNVEDVDIELTDNSLGLTFNYFGLIVKDKFNQVSSRDNKYIPWDKIDLRLKRKMNHIKK